MTNMGEIRTNYGWFLQLVHVDKYSAIIGMAALVVMTCSKYVANIQIDNIPNSESNREYRIRTIGLEFIFANKIRLN